MSEAINNKRPRDTDEFSSQSQRPKLLSSIVVVKSPQNGDVICEDNDTTSSGQNSIKTRSDIEIRPENRNRNKRMFGSLVGHLGLARRNLEKDVIISKQNTVTSSVLHKNLEESKRLNNLRQNSLKTKMVNDKKIELERLTNIWRINLLQLKNFILTDTSLKICWLPAHHNDATNALLVRRNSEIDALILERERKDAQIIDDLFHVKKTSNLDSPNLEKSESSISTDHEDEESRLDRESAVAGVGRGDFDDGADRDSSPYEQGPGVNEEGDGIRSTEGPSEADLW